MPAEDGVKITFNHEMLGDSGGLGVIPQSVIDRMAREIATRMSMPSMFGSTGSPKWPRTPETWRYGTIIRNRTTGEVAMFIGAPELAGHVNVLFLDFVSMGSLPVGGLPEWEFYESMA